MAIGANVIQVFTKTPNQWREPEISQTVGDTFRGELERSGLAIAFSHDSYLINLASPDPLLSGRSVTSFIAELARCQALGITAVVSHPGNHMDGRDVGLQRNAENYTRALAAVPGALRVLLETPAGSGTCLGATFEEIARLRELIPPPHRDRVGFCADTCHLYSAGYDLVGDFDAVWRQWDDVIGLAHLECLHLNDSATSFASRRDRHALIGEGSLGPGPFQRIMTDPRFRSIPKIIETPKGSDQVRMDRRMLQRLRSYAAMAE